MPTAPPEPPPLKVGSIVEYDSPDWGPSAGRVLDLATWEQSPRRVLVQDLHPNGAREYWPLADLRVRE